MVDPTFTKVNADRSGTVFKNMTGGDPTQALDYGQFSLPLNTIPEFANIRFVKITINKLLGGENRGKAGVFGIAGGTSTTTQPVDGVSTGLEDANGWSLMQFNANNQNVPQSGTGSEDHERVITDTTYFAQRFQTTQSAGAFMFRFQGRVPSGSDLRNLLLFSIWDDKNNGNPLDPAPFNPGKPLVGSNDVGNSLHFVTGNAFTSLGQFTYGLTKNVVQGWVAIPFTLLPQSSTTLSSVAVAVEIGLQTPVPPSTNLWLVIRVNSAGSQFNVGVANTGASATTNFEALNSTDAGQTWNKEGSPATQFVLAEAIYYGLAPVSSIGGYQPDLSNTQVHMPGTVGITSAAQGQSSFISPIIQDRNGTRLDTKRVIKNSGEGDTDGLNSQTGSGMWTVEPVTGDHFVAVSVPGQNNQVAQISFPTSIVATRDGFGDVFVAFPCSVASTSYRVFPPLRRMEYTIECQFNDF